MTNFYSFDP